MKLEITMTTGWIAAETVEIPDEELKDLWRTKQDEYIQKDWGDPDWNEFIHELIFVRFEQPLQKRLETVEGIRGIDWQESIIRDQDGDIL
jgi:hypothetical protein